MGRGVSLIKGCRQHLDVVAAGLRNSLQFAISLDGWSIRIFQVDRVKIERQVEQERRTGQNHADSADDDYNAMSLQKIIQRRETGEAYGCRLPRRVQDGQHRRD